MIPTEHLTVGGAASAAIAFIGSVFNAIRFSSNSLVYEIQPLSHFVSPAYWYFAETGGSEATRQLFS